MARQRAGRDGRRCARPSRSSGPMTVVACASALSSRRPRAAGAVARARTTPRGANSGTETARRSARAGLTDGPGTSCVVWTSGGERHRPAQPFETLAILGADVHAGMDVVAVIGLTPRRELIAPATQAGAAGARGWWWTFPWRPCWQRTEVGEVRVAPGRRAPWPRTPRTPTGCWSRPRGRSRPRSYARWSQQRA